MILFIPEQYSVHSGIGMPPKRTHLVSLLCDLVPDW